MNASVGEVKYLLRNIDSSKAKGYEFAQPISSFVNMSLSLSCQISTIVILSGIFVAIVALIK